MAIIDFESNGISLYESKNIVSKIESEIIKLSCISLVERSALDEVLKEQGLQQSGCLTTQCAVEIGQLLGTNKLLMGSVGRIGRLYTINVKIISVESGLVLNAYEINSDSGIEKLYESKTVELAYKICGRRYMTEPKITKPIPKRTYTPPLKTYTFPKPYTPPKKTYTPPPITKYAPSTEWAILNISGFVGGRNSSHWKIGGGLRGGYNSLVVFYGEKYFIGDGISYEGEWYPFPHYTVKLRELGMEFEIGILKKTTISYELALAGTKSTKLYNWSSRSLENDIVGPRIKYKSLDLSHMVNIYYNYVYNGVLIKIGYGYSIGSINFMSASNKNDSWYNYLRNKYGGIKLRIDFSLDSTGIDLR